MSNLFLNLSSSSTTCLPVIVFLPSLLLFCFPSLFSLLYSYLLLCIPSLTVPLLPCSKHLLSQPLPLFHSLPSVGPYLSCSIPSSCSLPCPSSTPLLLFLLSSFFSPSLTPCLPLKMSTLLTPCFYVISVHKSSIMQFRSFDCQLCFPHSGT